MGVTVAEGTLGGAAVERASFAMICKISVARVGVSLGVGVSVGVLVAVEAEVAVAVGVGAIVCVLVGVFVGSAAIVGSSETDALLSNLNTTMAITTPITMQARVPITHFFKRPTPVSAEVYRPHGTETRVEMTANLKESDD